MRDTSRTPKRDKPLPGAAESDGWASLRRIDAGLDGKNAGTRAVDDAAAAREGARKAQRAARLVGDPGRAWSADAAQIAAEARRPARASDRAVGPVGDPLVDVPDHVERAPHGLAP